MIRGLALGLGLGLGLGIRSFFTGDPVLEMQKLVLADGVSLEHLQTS